MMMIIKDRAKLKGRFLKLVLLFVLFLPAISKGQTFSKYIVVDQFGYLPDSKKIAVLRDPQTGFDASESFAPGTQYAVVNKASGLQVFTGSPVKWKNGVTDISSGDKVWWFDFSTVTEPGMYYVLDIDKNLKSYEFEISKGIYSGVLRHAVRYFFYQRAGFAKEEKYTGIGWSDGASHLGNLQDKNARPYNDKNNASKEFDLHGAWYDAGDFHRYTNWTANYVTDFMRAYMEAPDVWTDDYNIAESGNGIPDFLDEAKWGLDHLLRMQRSNGSVLSIVNVAHASPPSSATGQSVYGTASTSATLNTAAAFAAASKVYGSIGMTDYATQLKESAIKAWDWADANPNVLFKNNDAASGTIGIGGGQQEVDDYGRFAAKMEAACFLHEITGDIKYKTFFESNYTDMHMFLWNNYVSLFAAPEQETLLYYAKLPGVDPVISEKINSSFKQGMNGNEHFQAHIDSTDPYMSYISFYGWGTNSIKSLQGSMFTDYIYYNIDPSRNDEAKKNAETYIHYIHGLNPLNIVYLSNMYNYGGDNCVNEFYHTWFTNGSAKWDRVGVSTYGPPPGFLTGGANPGYNWDSGCPGGNSGCNGESITPPKGQPNQKSYKDFNTSWPLNSWEVTENSDAYQINYIRLISKFIQAGYDCSGTLNGTASFDVCNKCSGGTTGITPSTKQNECGTITANETQEGLAFEVYPNPSSGSFSIKLPSTGFSNVQLSDMQGRIVFELSINGQQTLIEAKTSLASGLFILRAKKGNRVIAQKVEVK